jgi:hypothetical protein
MAATYSPNMDATEERLTPSSLASTGCSQSTFNIEQQQQHTCSVQICMLASPAALAALAAAVVASATVPSHLPRIPCDFYVSHAHGSDSGAGSSKGTAFKTIDHARIAAQTVESGRGKRICLMADGVHYLTTMVNIGAKDTGTAAQPLQIVGCPDDVAAGNRPVVSGGRLIDGISFKADPAPSAGAGGSGLHRVSADISGAIRNGAIRPSLLLVNGEWAQRARSPPRGGADDASYSRQVLGLHAPHVDVNGALYHAVLQIGETPWCCIALDIVQGRTHD